MSRLLLRVRAVSDDSPVPEKVVSWWLLMVMLVMLPLCVDPAFTTLNTPRARWRPLAGMVKVMLLPATPVPTCDPSDPSELIRRAYPVDVLTVKVALIALDVAK